MEEAQGMSRIWWVYMIECRGGKIYTGIAKDPQARYRQHRSGRGAAFTRINPPVVLLAKRPCGSRSDALREERTLRRLSGMEKRTWAERSDSGEANDPGDRPRDHRRQAPGAEAKGMKGSRILTLAVRVGKNGE